LPSICLAWVPSTEPCKTNKQINRIFFFGRVGVGEAQPLRHVPKLDVMVRPTFTASREGEEGGLLEPRSWRPAWAAQLPVSKINKLTS
jgi:hypothetical protein